MSVSEHADDNGQDFIFICPSYLDCVLAAVDITELAELENWCRQQPSKSYGRIFVAAEAEPTPAQLEQLAALSAPAGVGVTCVRRSSTPGSALVNAVEAWLDEWLRGDPMSGRHVQLWLGARHISWVDAHWTSLEQEVAALWAAAAEYREQLAQ